jgi:hypothetical protein
MDLKDDWADVSLVYWDIADDGLDADENWRLGTGIIDRLGGRGGCVEKAVLAVERAGENARVLVGEFSSSCHPASDCLPEGVFTGAGIWLGVLGLWRGGVVVGGRAWDGVWAREGGLNGAVEEVAVDTDEVNGVHGREDVIEALETLLLYCGPRGGTGGISSDWPRKPKTDGRLGGVAFKVAARSSDEIFVELFHGCFTGRILTVGESAPSLVSLGDDSGVKLWLYLWPGRSGVIGVGGWLPRNENIDDRWRRIVGAGSEEGSREKTLVTERGVTGTVVCFPEIFLANLRNGDIDLEIVFAWVLPREPGGVAR